MFHRKDNPPPKTEASDSPTNEGIDDSSTVINMDASPLVTQVWAKPDAEPPPVDTVTKKSGE